MKQLEKIYCSLDIETSGFDPLVNEILEVGFAVFEVKDSKFKIVEEWTQVFKPSKPVQPQILGLTGISQKELDEAPKFSEFKEILQKKLGEAIIVGHNVSFDIKFLEAFGLKFSGHAIDTLDLVQWILPTHHSYNLENLMHTFGIAHKEAHRALADSKATIKLLEKLLQTFSNFSEDLKRDAQKVLAPYNFPWQDLLSVVLKSPIANEPKKAKFLSQNSQKPRIDKFQPRMLYNFGLGENYMEEIASSLSNNKTGSLLVLPKAQTVLDFYRSGLVTGAVFLPQQQFNKKKFAALMKKKNLLPDEVRFVLKILVWQKTNWQTQTILDLNLSFFGGQFRAFISGGDFEEDKKAKVLACYQSTFLQASKQKLFSGRQIIICGLNEFESAVTTNIGSKTSWGYVNYLLKSFYNSELNLGQQQFKASVEEGLKASDLFFGLVGALLQTDPSGFIYYKILTETENDEKYQKIKSAAENYQTKLVLLNKVFKSEAVAEFAENLYRFFSPEENMVKWIELSENRCAFLSMPLDITGLVLNALKPFGKVSFADTLGSEKISKFFIGRLGLKDYKLKIVLAKNKESIKEKVFKQGDLFSGLKKVFGKKIQTVNYHSLPKTATGEELLKLIAGQKTLPAAILFSSSLPMREFYEQNYQILKQRAALLVQSGSGGSNKIFRNFSINPHSLLLATDRLILRHLNGQSQVEAVETLPVKVLIICRLPFEQFTHPYQEAVSKASQNAFMDYSLPKALLNFHNLIKFFYTPLLTDVYVIDQKLSKDYASVFRDYYKFIPGGITKV